MGQGSVCITELPSLHYVINLVVHFRNGKLSLIETLTGLNLLIYGSFKSKIKCTSVFILYYTYYIHLFIFTFLLVAISVVNRNGDGTLTPETVESFHKECLLPVLEGFDKLNLIPNFGSLRELSLMKSIFTQMKFCMLFLYLLFNH